MSPHRLLLIDDDLAITDLITEALADEGYTVRRVSSPERALAHLLTLPPVDLVVSDAFITQYGEPYAWLAHLRDHTAAPIIICSGWPKGTFADYRTHGFAGVLAKPFDLDDLLELVASCCASSRVVTAADANAPAQERDARPSGLL